MKVAVISNLETQQGRSSFIILLASLFSRTQCKKATIFSTGKMDRLLSQASTKETQTSIKSIPVLKAMLSSASITVDELYDYAIRLGKEEVYAFDVLSSSVDPWELENMLVDLVHKVTADLTLVEMIGSIENEFNQRVLKECDVVLNVFNHNTASMQAVCEYVENYDSYIVARTGFVCQKYDANVLSEKKLGTFVKMNARNIMSIPYNPVVEKESIAGTLDTLAKYIAVGHNEVITLRSRLLEVMQFLYDSPNFKYIKGVNEWHK